MSLSSSTGTKASIQVEDGNFRLNLSTWTPDWSEPEDWGLRFLEQHPVTSLPMNQKKVTQPATLTPNLLLNTLPWNTLESSVFWAWVVHYLWLALVINLSLLQTDVSVCLASDVWKTDIISLSFPRLSFLQQNNIHQEFRHWGTKAKTKIKSL